MKRISFFTLLMLLTLSVPVLCQNSSWYFGGFRIDYEPKASYHVTAGQALPIGEHFYSIPNMDVAGRDSTGIRSGSAAVDLTWIVLSGKIGAVHLILSPGVDWVNGNYNTISYWTGAVGLLGFVKASGLITAKTGPFGFVADHFGAWAGAKWKGDFNSWFSHTTKFPDGLQIGVGLAYRP